MADLAIAPLNYLDDSLRGMPTRWERPIPQRPPLSESWQPMNGMRLLQSFAPSPSSATAAPVSVKPDFVAAGKTYRCVIYVSEGAKKGPKAYVVDLQAKIQFQHAKVVLMNWVEDSMSLRMQTKAALTGQLFCRPKVRNKFLRTASAKQNEEKRLASDPQYLEIELRTSTPRTVEGHDVERSVQQILSALRQPTLSVEERIKLIYEAELQPVPKDLQREFLDQLRVFIDQQRDTQDPEVLRAVMCSIRKFVAELPAAELPEIGFLLDPSHVAKLPIELELTVAKMVVRKLTANPPQQDDPYPQLAEQLWELAHDYLRERFISRKHFGAVALETTTALLMCRSPHMSELLSQLKDLGSRWFVEAMSDYFEETIGEIVRRNSDERRGPTVRALEAAVQILGVMQPTRT